jgi:hypothetical protein
MPQRAIINNSVWKRCAFFIGLLSCSFLIEYTLYNSYQADNILAIFFYVILGTLWLWCFIKIFKVSLQKDKRIVRIRYTLLVAGLLSLVPIFVTYRHYQQKIDVPTLLKAERHGVYADFKTNGTYVIMSGPWATRKHHYGNYTLQGNIIKIDSRHLDDVLQSNVLVIKDSDPEDERKRPESDRLDTRRYLVQINNQGGEIKARYMGKDSAGRDEYIPYRFKIVVDNMASFRKY